MISIWMCKRTRDMARIAIGVFCTLSFAGVARATIVDCSPRKDSYTVFLSEPTYTPRVFLTKDRMHEFLERLQFELDLGRDGKWVHSPLANVRFVVCRGRSPKLDGQEFVPSLVENMYSERVLIEMWGNLSAKREGDGKDLLTAQINYLLVPMKFASDQHEEAPEALERLKYQTSAEMPGDSAPLDFVPLIARPLDVDTFVAAALGFKLLREGHLELGHRNLCRANALLTQMENRNIVPGTLRNLTALRAFVLRAASRAIEQAQTDPGYSRTGLLRLQDSKQPCGKKK